MLGARRVPDLEMRRWECEKAQTLSGSDGFSKLSTNAFPPGFLWWLLYHFGG
jgi:hypothetical protein